MRGVGRNDTASFGRSFDRAQHFGGVRAEVLEKTERA